MLCIPLGFGVALSQGVTVATALLLELHATTRPLSVDPTAAYTPGVTVVPYTSGQPIEIDGRAYHAILVPTAPVPVGGGLLLGASLLSGCDERVSEALVPSSTPAYGGRLRVGIIDGDQSGNLDAHKPVGGGIIRGWALYSKFWEWNDDVSTRLGLAEFAEPNADASAWTIRIKPGLEFHHGKSIGADDMLFSILRLTDPQLASPFAGLVGAIDRQALVAVWGMESNFGSFQGDKSVIRSLATLAYEGRRPAFAHEQLLAALRILQHGDVQPSRMRGSWAGAMGQTQFMPTTYNQHAVDFDGDGKRDLWNSSSDALASAAHYLQASGWQRTRATRALVGENFGAMRSFLARLPAGVPLLKRVAAISGDHVCARDAHVWINGVPRAAVLSMDRHGRPLMRMTFNWQDNDLKMNQFMKRKMEPLAQSMNPDLMQSGFKDIGAEYDVRPYQTTHNTGGHSMSETPTEGVVNRFGQAWDKHNVFAMGAGNFVQNTQYNPTGLVGGMAYWTINAIRTQYLSNPRPLV